MCELPLDPLLSKMVITGSQIYSCFDEALSIVSLLSVPSIFHRPRKEAAEADGCKR